MQNKGGYKDEKIWCFRRDFNINKSNVPRGTFKYHSIDFPIDIM